MEKTIIICLAILCAIALVVRGITETNTAAESLGQARHEIEQLTEQNTELRNKIAKSKKLLNGITTGIDDSLGEVGDIKKLIVEIRTIVDRIRAAVQALDLEA